jgi:hypothetical protein
MMSLALCCAAAFLVRESLEKREEARTLKEIKRLWSLFQLP